MKNLKDIFNINEDININNIKTNTKEINKGDLFVCIKGFNVDRHDFVKEAEKKGAAALIVEHNVDSTLPQIIVNNTNESLVDIVTKFYDYPSKKMTMIGVTGTDGKTTTSTVLYQLLNQINNCGYLGTNGAKCNNYEESTNNTTPTAEHLHRILNNFVKQKCDYVSMECASEALSQGRCKSIEYDYSIFTNLTHEHLNFHKTMKNYLESKAILFKQTKKDGYCIINIDDKYSKEISKYCNGKIIYYGQNKNADVRFSDVVITSSDTMFKITYMNKTYNIHSPLLGMFNVYNLTAALSVLLTLNINIEKLDFSSLFVDGRMNNIDCGQDFKVIVDYAHTPNGYLNLFSLTKKLPCNKTIVVAGSAGERDKTKRPVMGKILVDNADLVVFTCEDPRSEKIDSIIDDLTSDVKDKSNKFVRINDRSKAIKYAIDIANKNDLVLILGKGNETYEAMSTGKVYFNDIEEAKKALEMKVNVKN